MVCMLAAEDLQCLKVIAMMGGCRGPVFASSQTLGSALGISPQTTSRRLQALERLMLITRSVNPDGQHITLTPGGEEELRREYSEYCKIFGSDDISFVLVGNLVSGLGEGRYYMSLEPYKKQFLEKLGFEPFPGTLNIKLSQASVRQRKRLDQLEWIEIQGFTADDRTFGSARCLPCRIGEWPCGIVVPVRSHYPDNIIELVSPVALREALGIKDTDMVTVEVVHDR
jgi:riboflavin kinase, archaea type